MAQNLSTARQIYILLRRVHVHPAYFCIPVILSLFAAFFEGVGMGLLIPLLNGFLTKDFSFLKEIPVMGDFLSLLPTSLTGRDRTLFLVLLAVFVVAIVLKNILRYTASTTMAYVGTRAIHHLRKNVFDAYLHFGKLYFDRTSVGQHSIVLSQFTTEALLPLMTVDRFVHAIFSLLAYCTVMLMISWELTLFALPLFLVIHIAVRSMIGLIRQTSRELVLSIGSLGKKVVEILSTMPLVKAFNTEDIERERYTEISDERARLEFKMSAIRYLISPLQEIITLIAGLMLLGGMLYLLVSGRAEAAPPFLVYFYLVLNASNRFGSISGFQSLLANASGPLNEVLQVFERAGKEIVPEGRRVFPGLRDRMEFCHLSFCYLPEREVLHDVHFTVEKGQVTALVGPTGAGKTTIVSLLLRYYDCSPGSILLDGVDVREFTARSLRTHMAFVSQETLLLHESLRTNISYGMEEVSEAKLRDAVRRARLEDFVRELPQGLDTLIGDRGVKLSGGEKQRVAIARALLRGADILILDEATSSLDSRTERLIQEAVEEAITGKTAIVIAHRLSTIHNADKIVVIEDGRCREEGTLAELLQQKGKFFEYWEEQKFF